MLTVVINFIESATEIANAVATSSLNNPKSVPCQPFFAHLFRNLFHSIARNSAVEPSVKFMHSSAAFVVNAKERGSYAIIIAVKFAKSCLFVHSVAVVTSI